MKLQKIKSAWFDLPGDKDGAAFEIKHLRSGEINKITDATNKRRFEFRKDEKGELVPVPIIEIDGANERELTVVAAVTDWRWIYDHDGEPMECNELNKLRLCRELSEKDFTTFTLFVQDCRKTLSKEIAAQDEQAEKN